LNWRLCLKRPGKNQAQAGKHKGKT
jgi:hypothetical protein